ncbi:MinD/ParA family protein [Heliorestis acidaminivorans]|uniref:MinD/ParA family protein n=1 Tax=Heliorestis acidaminivorans TaxID=553427 RepID=A0A6I0F3P7_9FIRM|nr:MinD/ParA family protein [Heliorestis acidaminivorans]KAB2954380.1 MinD/ParA family protein [Heliorestis acidaminivorans]
MKDQAEKLRIMMQNMRQQVEFEIAGEESPTRIICISSGKGGVGKTNLTLNLGLALVDYGQRVLILDADMGMANVDVILGKVPPHNLYHVIRGEKKLSEVICKGPKGIGLISGGSGIVELANLGAQELDRFIEGLSELDGTVDILLIDTGAGISKNVLSYIYAADELIVVTTPEPTAITDAYGLIKSVEMVQKKKPISLVVNKIENEKEGNDVSQKLLIASKKFLNRELNVMGYIPDDPVVSKSVKIQKPFYLHYENSSASLAISRLAANLCNVAVKADNKGTLSRLFGRMKSFFG